jgi:D-3-phosphoglycerate dehydrogenase / 2-oxoglutarate reductase
MKIVVLNEVFLQKNHIKRLRDLGEVEMYSDTDSEEKAIDRVKGAAIIIADPFVTPLNKNVIEAASNLKLIDLSVIGYDLVDVETANKKQVRIANIPGFSTQAVAELAIGLMLSLMRNIPLADKEMRKQPFEVDAGNPSHKPFKGRELKGKTLGIVGLGRIGQQVAQWGGL